MNKRFCKKICTLSISAAMLTSLSISAADNSAEKKGELGSAAIDSVSSNVYKTEDNANPISAVKFCADPTSVEYNGRLYVYGTSDHEQYEKVGANGENHYGFIYSLEIFSTNDMVNWEYHGSINVKKIAPWIANAWAPSIVSRVEDDGLTHFYMYFSNNGVGVGVITSTDPVGPWSDPLGKPLVSFNTPGLKNCPNPFDPGALIDENGTGWLSLGGGNPGKYKTDIAKIVKLGDDMISFDSDFVGIETPYFNEASELNYINGTYVYSYCNDWQERKLDVWDYEGIEPPHGCSIAYLTSTNPLDASSWEYKGEYLLNAGDSPDKMDHCNNHSHLQKFKDKWYLIHHTMILRQDMKIKGGFRSICVENVSVDEENITISLVKPTRAGVSQNDSLDPYSSHSGTEMFTCADIDFSQRSNGTNTSKSLENGSWINIKGADFTRGATEFCAEVKGSGRIEVRLDSVSSQPVAAVDFNADDWQTVKASSLAKFDSGKHDVYLVFSNSSIELASWKFTEGEVKETNASNNNSNGGINITGIIIAVSVVVVLAAVGVISFVLVRKRK